MRCSQNNKAVDDRSNRVCGDWYFFSSFVRHQIVYGRDKWWEFARLVSLVRGVKLEMIGIGKALALGMGPNFDGFLSQNELRIFNRFLSCIELFADCL